MNVTNGYTNGTRTYTFLPVDIRVRIALYSPLAILGFYAFIANGMILYLKNVRGGTRQPRVMKRKSFDRFLVTNTFVQSLAASDFTCALLSLPLVIATNFLDIIDTDFKCKAVRFCNIFFPVVTIINLFIIGIERYLAVFHPFRVPSLRGVKILVILAWVISVPITIMGSVTFRLQRVDVGSDSYTLDCNTDKTVPVYRVMFLGFTGVVYVIPAIILSYTNIRILLKLRRKKIGALARRVNSWRFYGTFAFVALIFTFTLPYFFFVLFSGINMVFNPQFNFTTGYIIRRTNAVLAYSNAAISPTVLIVSMRDLRTMFKNAIPECCTRRSNAVMDETFIRNQINRLNLVELQRGTRPTTAQRGQRHHWNLHSQSSRSTEINH